MMKAETLPMDEPQYKVRGCSLGGDVHAEDGKEDDDGFEQVEEV